MVRNDSHVMQEQSQDQVLGALYESSCKKSYLSLTRGRVTYSQVGFGQLYTGIANRFKFSHLSALCRTCPHKEYELSVSEWWRILRSSKLHA